MKTQIIVDKNLVMMDDTSVNVDCSKFKEQFVFCEVNEKEKWIEKEPFNGREQPKRWNEIEEFIDIAKSKSNPPNSYSVWDEITKFWVEDEALKKEYEKSLIPKAITLRQARLYLLSINLLDDVEASIASIVDETTKKMVQIEWEYAKDIERNSPTIRLLATSVGLDDAGLDNLFIEANKL